jgi:hypothetical protein
MADRTVVQEAILAEETIFKLRRNGQTDYSILTDVIDETVSFTPEGGETKSYKAISGKSIDIPTKISMFTTQFAMWMHTTDIEVLKGAFGNPTITGTGPYTHTFNPETISQQMDVYIEGLRYGNTAQKVTITGSASSIKFDSLDIEKEGLMKFRCTIKIPSQNFDLAVVNSTSL